jgi:hypothetical protein
MRSRHFCSDHLAARGDEGTFGLMAPDTGDRLADAVIELIRAK